MVSIPIWVKVHTYRILKGLLEICIDFGEGFWDYGDLGLIYMYNLNLGQRDSQRFEKRKKEE